MRFTRPPGVDFGPCRYQGIDWLRDKTYGDQC
jgi:hypothetical protein